MEKDLYYILQEIKGKRNESNSDYIIQKISNLYEEFEMEEKNFSYYSKKQMFYNIKYIILTVITFGIYDHFNNEKFLKNNDELNGYMDEIEKRYYSLRDTLENLCRSVNGYTKESLDKNYNQIENFLKLMKSVNKEEQDKILNYKIGVNNE